MQRNGKMDEQVRLLALAHLKNNTTPADTAEIMGISYVSALKLRKELFAAEKHDTILELFKLNKAALNILLESVTKQLTPAIEAFNIGELVESEVRDLAKSINGAQILNIELQAAALALTNKITQVAIIANNADTLLNLAKAICELQAVFKISNPDMPVIGSFERYLKE